MAISSTGNIYHTKDCVQTSGMICHIPETRFADTYQGSYVFFSPKTYAPPVRIYSDEQNHTPEAQLFKKMIFWGMRLSLVATNVVVDPWKIIQTPCRNLPNSSLPRRPAGHICTTCDGRMVSSAPLRPSARDNPRKCWTKAGPKGDCAPGFRSTNLPANTKERAMAFTLKTGEQESTGNGWAGRDRKWMPPEACDVI
jgi:hypothetical protein